MWHLYGESVVFKYFDSSVFFFVLRPFMPSFNDMGTDKDITNRTEQ